MDLETCQVQEVFYESMSVQKGRRINKKLNQKDISKTEISASVSKLILLAVYPHIEWSHQGVLLPWEGLEQYTLKKATKIYFPAHVP